MAISKKSAAIIAFLLAAAAIIFSVSGFLRTANERAAIAAGFPDIDNIAAAKIYLYDDGGLNERLAPLSEEDTSALIAVLSKLNPKGEPVDENALEPSSGWPWEEFLVVQNDGQEHRIKAAVHHVVIDDELAWEADYFALGELSSLHTELYNRYI